MRALVEVTKHHRDADGEQWTLFIQRGKNRWYHIPTRGMANLKQRAIALNLEHRDFHVGNRDVWQLKDCTCEACHGSKLRYHKPSRFAPEGKWGPEECPRCAGKGYMTVHDEWRWAAWLTAQAEAEMGCGHTVYPERKPRMKDLVEQAQLAETADHHLKKMKAEFEEPSDYASVSRGY